MQREQKGRHRRLGLLAWLAAFALVIAACGGDGGTADTTAAGTDATEPTGDMSMPGEGVSVVEAKANWNTEDMVVEVVRQLLGELGYEVTDPRQNELAPPVFYLDLAAGEYDFWINGWFPNHTPFLDGDLPDGSKVGDHVSVVGEQVKAGALQGYLVDKKTADEHGITTLDQIANDDALRELFDLDGNGQADILGCNDGWGCQLIINDTIAAIGDDKLEQISGEYSALFADAASRVAAGEPTLVYTWTPNYTVATLIPGENAVWIGVENPVEGQETAAEVPAGQCVADPCTMGFAPADILIVANNDFLAENPAAQKLFELFTISVADINAQNLLMNEGADTASDVQQHAADWIAANRAQVDDWLAQARAAAG